MKKNIKTTEAIFPMPVLMIATYSNDGSVDVMNAAWGTMIDRDLILLNLSEDHKTFDNIIEKGGFTVSIADAKHVKEADYFGLVSGHDCPNKLEKSGLTATRSQKVYAPIINEFPICLECEFLAVQNSKFAYGVVGRVLNVSAEESLFTDDKIDMSKVEAIAYDSYTHGYYKVGERVGNAFKDGLELK